MDAFFRGSEKRISQRQISDSASGRKEDYFARAVIARNVARIKERRSIATRRPVCWREQLQ
jgi:hypothetical protein